VTTVLETPEAVLAGEVTDFALELQEPDQPRVDWDEPPPPGSIGGGGDSHGDEPPPYKPTYGEEERRKHQDWVRKWLAFLLVGFVGADIALGWIGGAVGASSWANVKDFLTATLPALIGLAGAAVGFYFGKE
jgi:hypothetical protein